MENTIDHILWVLLIFLYQSAHIFLMDYGNSLNQLITSDNITPNQTNRSNATIQISPEQIKVSSRKSRRYLNPENLKIGSDTDTNGQPSHISTKQTLNSQSLDLEDHESSSITSQNKSETSSNKQTKPGKTIQIQEQGDIQEIQIHNISHIPKQTSRKRKYQQDQYDKYSFRIEQQQKEEEQEQQEQSQYESQSDQQEQKIQNKPKQEESQLQQISLAPKNQIKKPIKPPPQKPAAIQMHIKDIQKCIKSCVPQGYRIKCTIKVASALLGIQNKYCLYVQDDKNPHPKSIISAKKQLLSWNPHYIISTDQDNHSNRSKGFVGILSGNFSGTQWHLFDNSERNPNSQLLTANYLSSLMGYQSLRLLETRKIDPRASLLPKKPILSKQILTKSQKNIIKITSATPKLQKGKYRLDFRGLAKVPSSKNFILNYKTAENSEKQCLLFAKRSQMAYTMHVSYPLSILQAFSLCLTSLNGKILVN